MNSTQLPQNNAERENNATMETEEFDNEEQSLEEESLAACEVEEEFIKPIYENGKYYCPWTKRKAKLKKLKQVFRKMFSKEESTSPCKSSDLDKALPVLKPDLLEFECCPISGIRYLWIGHSTSLVQFDDITLLTDPVFSEKFSSCGNSGIKRYRPVPCLVDELPVVNCVLISHSHFDHLDHTTVLALNKRFGSSLRWYVPQGLLKWMRECGCEDVLELTWWQEDTYSEDKNITVVCTPSRQQEKRFSRDDNKVLWCSWCVLGPRHSFYFCGDTAYCSTFKRIGRRYGPFALSTIPIGSYSPRSVLSVSHVDPDLAITIHEDLQSETSIGIHWGTFTTAQEPYMEPKHLLDDAVERRKMKPSEFFTVKHGEITVVGADSLNEVD